MRTEADERLDVPDHDLPRRPARHKGQHRDPGLEVLWLIAHHLSQKLLGLAGISVAADGFGAKYLDLVVGVERARCIEPRRDVFEALCAERASSGEGGGGA